MPIWPFRKRRRSGFKEDAQQPLTEKAPPEQQPTRAATYPPAGATQPIDIPRKASNRDSEPKRRALEAEKTADTGASQKENVPPPSSHRRTSREDITALPMSRKLESSPHLRPVDLERPHIPYNFRPYSASQGSIQRDMPISPSPRPHKLRSRRSAYENAAPSRRQSSKRTKKDERLREEEIRSMGAQMPIPKRPGDGPLRRDSKKMRGLGMKESYISLPADDDVDSNMTGVAEQRGWEIGNFDMFNPRPVVRLSGTPQYITPSSQSGPSPIAEMVRRDKEKMPASRDRNKKRETIGNRADDFDASDIRVLMERDAKRREKKNQEQQEKLDRKLRSRNGRNRGDSDKKRREAEEARKAEELQQREEDERRERDLMTPPTDIHPALRDVPAEQQPESVGLGIGARQAEQGAAEPGARYQAPDGRAENPFTDAAAEQAPTPPAEQIPMDDPVVETARQVRLSQTATPPLSPLQTAATAAGAVGATVGISQMMDSRRASDIPTPPPPITDTRRQSDPRPDRRAGAWATFFRRGGTNLRKPGDEKSPPSEASFSNTSRESMRNQPLPPHLIDTQVQTPRRKSGTPVRTQSKFREDLPEMPISPPDSRLSSPDVMTAAAAAATARRAGRSSAPVARHEDMTMAEAEQQGSFRNDTPVSPSIRSNRMTSMASVDSEGSWLASGSPHRHSTHSGVNRSIGSLNQRFTGSYEELGGDKDAEYFQRMSPDKRTKLSSSALAGAGPDEETDEEGDGARETATPGDPLTMHESVRRQPTLVHRDPRVKSREGLLTEYSTAGRDTPEPTSAEPMSATSAGTGRNSMGFDPDEPEPEMQRASSVDYGKGHARQISAGSARLIGILPRSPTEPVPPPRSHPDESLMQ